MSKNNGAALTQVEFQFPQKKESQGFLKTIYNREEGTYFGRTIESWGEFLSNLLLLDYKLLFNPINVITTRKLVKIQDRSSLKMNNLVRDKPINLFSRIPTTFFVPELFF